MAPWRERSPPTGSPPSTNSSSTRMRGTTWKQAEDWCGFLLNIAIYRSLNGYWSVNWWGRQPPHHASWRLDQVIVKLKPRPNDRNIVERNMLHALGHRVAMCCDMLGVVGSSLKMVKFELCSWDSYHWLNAIDASLILIFVFISEIKWEFKRAARRSYTYWIRPAHY